MHDDLLEKLVGTWRIERLFAADTAENAATVEWVLEGRWLRIQMKDIASPSQYEAHVYITRMDSDGSYPIYWHDTFGGTLPEIPGVGQRNDDSILFSWKEPDSELRNTFTWNAPDGTWTSKIEQTDNSGVWTTFCTDTYRRSNT